MKSKMDDYETPLKQFDDEQFRKAGYELIDWIADYHKNIEEYRVLSESKPDHIYNQLPESAPESPCEFSEIMHNVDQIIMPGVTHWQSPDFFAFFPCNNSGPSVLGEMLSAGIGVQGMLWQTSPACTELETKVMDWLVELLDLPDFFHSKNSGGGVIQDTASSSSLIAILAARHKFTNGKAPSEGIPGDAIAYASTQAHSSIEKAMNIAGFGTDNFRKVNCDQNYSMDPKALEKAIEKDLADGKTPFFVSATTGTTSTNAMDPLTEISKICKKYNLWLHVDAAMSGTAAICEEYRFIHKGIEGADSYTFNPHKWMLTNFDCNAFFIKDKNLLVDTLSILPEYLRNTASDSKQVIDYRDWQIPLGRRFRALKLWFVLRMYGAEAIRAMIRYHVKLAQDFAKKINLHPDFEVIAPVHLNLVCFKHKAGNKKTQEILEAINNSGKAYLTHTKLEDTYVIRVCIGQAKTSEKHVNKLLNMILEENDKVRN